MQPIPEDRLYAKRRLGVWLVEAAFTEPPCRRMWELADCATGVKITATQHGAQSFTVMAYAQTFELAVDEILAIANRYGDDTPANTGAE